MAEFLVEMELRGIEGLPAAELGDLRRAEAARARELVGEGALLRLWRPAGEPARNIGLWRAADEATLEELISSLPLAPFLRVTYRCLAPHPNDPGERSGGQPDSGGSNGG